MSVTVKDVARVAGVSTATVSRALRGFDTVDPALREHVLEVANRLNYVGSPAAAALSTGRAGTIGIITPYTDRMSFQRMLTGVERAMRTTKTDILLYCTGDPSDPHPVPPHKRLARRVDGFLVLSLSADSPDLEHIMALEMPVAMFGTTGPWNSSVRIDDRGAARNATQLLLSQGHDRVGIIYGREIGNPGVLEHQRYLGVQDALDQTGVALDDRCFAAGGYTMHGGAEAMERLLAADEPPTAVFAFSDEMAAGAVRTLHRRGLRPGTDVAVIGFDGHDIADALDLTTVAVPYEEIGALAARNLVADITHPTRDRTSSLLPTELIERDSTNRWSR